MPINITGQNFSRNAVTSYIQLNVGGNLTENIKRTDIPVTIRPVTKPFLVLKDRTINAMPTIIGYTAQWSIQNW